MPIHHNGRTTGYLTATGPTAPFTGAVVVAGDGTRQEPYQLVGLARLTNIATDGAQVCPFNVPRSPTGVLRLKQVIVYYSGAAAGVRLQPYLNLREGAVDAVIMLDSKLTLTAAEGNVWDVNILMSTDPTADASLSIAEPLYLTVTNHAAADTDDAMIYTLWDWWDEMKGEF